MTIDASANSLIFLPLGGAGEIGMNLNLYGCDGKWLIVDLGVSFGGDSMPGIDVYMADPAFIAERRKDLVGIVLTHGHEDHLGAVQYLWTKLKCPVYATPFAISLLRAKLHESGLKVPLVPIPLGGRVTIGPFDVEMVTLTHSIPEPNSVAIRTRHGTVLHTGDWKFDPDPVIGAAADIDKLRRLGDEGVLAMVGDSTNTFSEGTAGSEAQVQESMIELFGRYHGRGRIAVACFASNVARLQSIAKAAAANDRHVALVGRSLWRIDEAARSNGYLKGVPAFLTEHDGAYLPNDRVVMICTGSQGEPRAALSRIAGNTHPHVTLSSGDVVIFSSRIIPGNENPIGALHNQLVKLGCEVVTANDAFVHVSGHPGREEMARMYQLVRPRVAVPVHGEARHLAEHAKLAEACQVPTAIIIENGAMLKLAPGTPEIIDHVPTGRLALDGERLVRMDSEILRARHRMIHSGSAVVTVVMDRMGKILGDPQVTALGLLDPEHEFDEHEAVVEAVRDAVRELPLKARQDDSVVREAARLAVRRHLKAKQGKKPITDVHLVRV